MAVDLDSMTPREQVAGLMRGNRGELQLGYSADSAALTVARVKRLIDFDTDDVVALDEPIVRDDLLPYAHGFADGMADALEDFPRKQPSLALAIGWTPKDYVRHGGDEFHRQGTGSAYLDGLADGQREFAYNLYPALRERPRPDYIQRFPERNG